MIEFLREDLSPNEANLVEAQQTDGKNYYLSGICMMSEVKNGNGRIYPLSELTREVEKAAAKINSGHYILGELNHPDTLAINPRNASHAITHIRMDGNNAIAKMKLLNTPDGNIVKAILEGGVRLGVSSRGAGQVGHDGKVSDFSFVTADVVSNPSAPDAFPDLIRESKENKRIVSLAEALVEDAAAQKYLAKEMKKFISKLLK